MKRRKHDEKLARFLGRVYDTKASSEVYWSKLKYLEEISFLEALRSS